MDYLRWLAYWEEGKQFMLNASSNRCCSSSEACWLQRSKTHEWWQSSRAW